MQTIPNRHPELPARVRLQTPIVDVCPESGEPQAGSWLTVEYQAGALLLDLHSVEKWIACLNEAIDLETVVQRLARDASAALGTEAQATGYYILRGGIELTCRSS